MDFRWNDWNIDHAASHGVTIEEIEAVVKSAQPPYPEDIGNGKFIVLGRGSGGRFLQVIYVLDDEDSLYVIHARPMTDIEKHRYRRRMR